jgi:hypothetical protein
VAEQIKFACEQGSLTIEVFGYEGPGAERQDDTNWLKCEVASRQGPFSGAFKSAFTTYDVIALAERLKSAQAPAFIGRPRPTISRGIFSDSAA